MRIDKYEDVFHPKVLFNQEKKKVMLRHPVYVFQPRLFDGQGCLKESLPADKMETLNELFSRRSSAFINVTGESF